MEQRHHDHGPDPDPPAGVPVDPRIVLGVVAPEDLAGPARIGSSPSSIASLIDRCVSIT
jgi:hypothetical protein